MMRSTCVDDLRRAACSASTRRPFFGASTAHAPRTSSAPSTVWQTSAGQRLNESAGE